MTKLSDEEKKEFIDGMLQELRTSAERQNWMRDQRIALDAITDGVEHYHRGMFGEPNTMKDLGFWIGRAVTNSLLNTSFHDPAE